MRLRELVRAFGKFEEVVLSSSSPTEQPFLRLARVTHPFEKAQAYLPGREDASDRGVPRRVVVDPLLWIGRIRPILPRKAAQTFQLKGTGGSDVRAHSMCIDVVPGTCVGGSAMPLMRHRWLTWGQNVGAPSAPACFRACGPLCGPSACGTLQFCKRPASLQGISQCPGRNRTSARGLGLLPIRKFAGTLLDLAGPRASKCARAVPKNRSTSRKNHTDLLPSL